MSGFDGFRVPDGLNEMLQGFVVKCMLEKPDDLFGFAADYFAKLQQENGKHVEEIRQATVVPVIKTGETSMSDSAGNPSSSSSTEGTSVALVNGASEDTAEDTMEEEEEEMVAPVRMPGRRRRQAVAAETYDPSKEEKGYERVVNPKSDEQKARLCQAMKNILLFKSCEPEQMLEILDAMLERKVDSEEKVIQQGDDGDNFYVVENGTYDVFVNVGENTTKKVHTFLDSGSFGELALMYNCPRNATIIAQSPGILWALDQAVFRRIVVGAAARKRRSYEALLEGVPMLSELREYERANLADALESMTFQDDECIIKQADQADCMYFVEDGFIRIVVEKGDEQTEVSVLKKGDYFGEMALVMNQPRSASVFAKGKARCARLEVGAFERLLGPCMEIMKRNIENYDMNRKALGLDN